MAAEDPGAYAAANLAAVKSAASGPGNVKPALSSPADGSPVTASSATVNTTMPGLEADKTESPVRVEVRRLEVLERLKASHLRVEPLLQRLQDHGYIENKLGSAEPSYGLKSSRITPWMKPGQEHVGAMRLRSLLPSIVLLCLVILLSMRPEDGLRHSVCKAVYTTYT